MTGAPMNGFAPPQGMQGMGGGGGNGNGMGVGMGMPQGMGSAMSPGMNHPGAGGMMQPQMRQVLSFVFIVFLLFADGLLVLLLVPGSSVSTIDA